jgi:hypothetical protein
MTNQKTKNIVLSIVIILIVAGIGYALKQKSKPTDGTTNVLGFPEIKPELSLGQSGDNIAYTADDNSFSFSYPKDFALTPLVETDDKTGEQKQNLIFKGKGDKDNFQIYISKFDSSTPLTASRIKSEIPDLNMEGSQDIAVDGARGVIFFSTDSQTKFKTREIWLSHGGKLYQITTYPEFDSKIASILSTWKWSQ